MMASHVVASVKRVQGGVGRAHHVHQLVILRLRPTGGLGGAGSFWFLVVPLRRQQRLSSADNHVHETLPGYDDGWKGGGLGQFVQHNNSLIYNANKLDVFGNVPHLFFEVTSRKIK